MANLLKDEVFIVAKPHPLSKQHLQCVLLCFIKEILVGWPEVRGDDTNHVQGTSDTLITTFHDVAAVQGLGGCGVWVCYVVCGVVCDGVGCVSGGWVYDVVSGVMWCMMYMWCGVWSVMWGCGLCEGV